MDESFISGTAQRGNESWQLLAVPLIPPPVHAPFQLLTILQQNFSFLDFIS